VGPWEGGVGSRKKGHVFGLIRRRKENPAREKRSRVSERKEERGSLYGSKEKRSELRRKKPSVQKKRMKKESRRIVKSRNVFSARSEGFVSVPKKHIRKGSTYR